MVETEKIKLMEMENMRLREENETLHQVVKKLNQTLNRLIGHYIGSGKVV